MAAGSDPSQGARPRFRIKPLTHLFSVNYFCRRIASPKSLLYESGCLN